MGESELQNENENPNNLPESFEAEFGNALGVEIEGAITRLGFHFRRQSTVENEVLATGERDDGTIIEISIKKSPSYRSPFEKEQMRKKLDELKRF